MIRKAFLMHIHPETHAEYERRHQPIWDDLAQALKDHGVSNYSIFLDAKRNLLFGYAELESEERWNAIAATPVCRRWWQHMKEVMPANDDGSPVSESLREVFHLD
jgi:L-rhamnose mutarotase